MRDKCLDGAFTVKCTLGEPCSSWWLLEDRLESCIADVVPLIQDASLIAEQNILKQGTRRLIFRHSTNDTCFLIKAFPLDTLRSRLQYRKYAYNETVNLITAQERGIPVPKLYGYGYLKRGPLVVWNAVCQEFVDMPNMEMLLNTQSNVKQRYGLVKRSLPLFKCLYETGCNHIDFKPGSILLGQGGIGIIIDFQYVSYLTKPSPVVLAAQAGYFAWDVCIKNKWIEKVIMREWFDELLNCLCLEPSRELITIFERTMTKRYSIKQRLAGMAGID